MASCPKCGKHLKRRKSIAKCRKCGILPQITINGLKPNNPWGSCFDAAAFNFLANNSLANVKMCHGIGIANKPGEEGQKIAHAWIESGHPESRAAIDPIWLIAQSAEHYRKTLQVELIIEYTEEQFMRLWAFRKVS